MARLNIEDSFWIDIMGVVAKLGDQDKAIGQALRFIKFAQEKFRNGQQITTDEFRDNGFSDALLGVFAKQTPSTDQAEPSTIQARGCEKHFGWLESKSEAGKRGGAVSSRRPRDKSGRLLPKQLQTDSKQTPSKTKLSQASSSYSSSYSLSKELNTSYLGEVESDTPNEIIPFEIKNPIGFFISKYREAFKTRYGCDPDVRGKVQGQIKILLKDYPLNKATQMIQVYCQMNGHKDWFKTKGHDFGTFMENLNPIAIALSNGVDPARSNDINWDEVFGKSAT